MTPRTTAVAAALVALALGWPTAASAVPNDDSTLVLTDSRTDGLTGVGISRVRVHNGGRVVVTLRHRDLRRRGYGDHFQVWIDTGRRHPGPDFVVAGGLASGTDWATGRATSRWRTRIDPLDEIGTCDSDLEISWTEDTARLTLGRDCLGGHQGRVRVSVQVGDAARHTDFVPAYHSFSPWVARA
jgi:hypothetical protein